jgi:sulfur relay (sulfurtransferase) complex TusBCD TusD component (DsrE family)
MDARGMTETGLSEGARRSTLDHLADWARWADKIMVF